MTGVRGGTRRATRRIRLAFALAAAVLITLGVAYYLTYEPSPRVGIKWRDGLPADRQSDLERQFLLVNPGRETPDSDRLMYDLLDTSRPNLEAIVTSPDVADTDRISRERFEIPFEIPYGESWMWIAHRTPVLRASGVVPSVIGASLLIIIVAAFIELRERLGRQRADKT